MSGDDRITTISELRHGYKNVNCIFIVIETGTTQQTKDGSLVRKCRVADRTGSIMFSIWNEEAEAVHTGDILKLTRGYSSVWKGSLVLYCGKYGVVSKRGEFTMLFSETPDMSLRTETVSPRSNSPPPSQSRQQHSSSGESSSADVSINHNEGRGQSGQGISGRHDNRDHSTHISQPSDFEVRHHKSGSGHHNRHSHYSHDDNSRVYSNGQENNNKPFNNDRRSHHMQSHDNYITSSGNSNTSRHHPYQRHNNGWR